MSQVFRLGLAVLLLFMGVASFWYLRSHHPSVQLSTPIAQAPVVSIIAVKPQSQRIPIDLHGVVTAANEVVLAAETNGMVTALSPRLSSGANFKRDELLLSVDDRELQRQLSTARATLQSAEHRLERLQAEKKLDQSLLGLTNVGDAYRNRLQEVHEQIKLATADVELARQRVEHAQILAPFDGRVQQVLVSVGQRIVPGVELVRFYGTTTARVRLAVSDRQLQLMDVPHLQQTNPATSSLILRQDLAGEYRYWQGRLLGIEASLDTRNQMIYLLASVDKAFELSTKVNGMPGSESTLYPLLSGQVLEARLSSRLIDDVAVIPRQLLQIGNVVWCVDSDNRLYRQTLRVLYTTPDKAYVQGLKVTQNLVSSVMSLAIDGMHVRLHDHAQSNAFSIQVPPPL